MIIPKIYEGEPGGDLVYLELVEDEEEVQVVAYDKDGNRLCVLIGFLPGPRIEVVAYRGCDEEYFEVQGSRADLVVEDADLE